MALNQFIYLETTLVLQLLVCPGDKSPLVSWLYECNGVTLGVITTKYSGSNLCICNNFTEVYRKATQIWKIPE